MTHRVHLPRRDLDVAAFKARHAQEADCTQRLGGDTILVDERDQPVVAVLDARRLAPDHDWAGLRASLPLVDYRVDYRTGAMLTRARTFGHLPRNTLRREWCTASTVAHEAPRLHDALCRVAPVLDAAYGVLRPDVHAAHRLEAEKVRPEYRIEQTIFTSGIVNHNNPLPYHHDGGNVKGAWSAMLVFRHGVEGGGLALPEYDCILDLPDESLLIFDGSSILHGVTPIRKVRPDGYRYSVVYYTMASMWKCLPPGEEVKRIRKLRTEREMKRAKGSPTPRKPEGQR